MQYLSEFEILSDKIAPVGAVPNVSQGYFLLLSRLPDSNAGDLTVQLTFFPSVPFPPIAVVTIGTSGPTISPGSILVDYEGGDGSQNFPTVGADNSVSFPIGSGKTVLFGIQPNLANNAADGPLGTGAFLSRGYVMIDVIQPSAIGSYQLAVVPEIRSVFFTVTTGAGGVLIADYSAGSEVAYVLPTPTGPLITLSKAKETKDTKEGKDGKEHKDGKDGKDSDGKNRDPEQVPIEENKPKEELSGLDDLSRRMAAIEEMVGTGRAFVSPSERPRVG